MHLKAFGTAFLVFFGVFAQPMLAGTPSTKPAEVKAVLVTKNFVITITRSSEEGVVEDDNVMYQGVSKKFGKSITLQGSTWHNTTTN